MHHDPTDRPRANANANAGPGGPARQALMHQEPGLPGRFSRLGVLLLLATQIACAVGLGLFVNDAVRDVRASAAALLRGGVPGFRHAVELEQALLLHQLIVARFMGDTMTHERFETIEARSQREMGLQLANLNAEYGATEEYATLSLSYRRFMERADDYLRAAGRVPPNRAELVLANTRLAEESVRLRGLLDGLEAKAESDLRRTSQQTEEQLGDVFLLVGLFTAAAIVISAFLIYHVRARLRSENRLARLARRDPLTGLPHRGALESRLGSLDGGGHALVLCGVDRFDEVITGIGHTLGDQLMHALAQRIERGARRLGGLAFRLDGASFGLILAEDAAGDALPEQIRSLRAEVGEPFRIDGHEIFVTLSLGSARTSTGAAATASLLRHADLARQAARRQGGDNWVDFQPEHETATADRLAMDADLRHAIARGELVLHYQPQQHLASGRLKGFEALLRWRRGGRLVSPADFIPLAEETGLIVPVGDWVLREACRQARAWNERSAAPMTMAINISMRQLQARDFADRVRAIVAETGVDARCLELEITESVAMHDPDRVRAALLALREIGVSIAMDDFGTGYSSLSYLWRLPLHTVKLDRSFIQRMPLCGPRDGDIVDAVITLAHGMELNVVAEGVETEEQCRRLAALGCDDIQGYFYGRPLEPAAAESFIAAAGAPAGGHMPRKMPPPP